MNIPEGVVVYYGVKDGQTLRDLDTTVPLGRWIYAFSDSPAYIRQQIKSDRVVIVDEKLVKSYEQVFKQLGGIAGLYISNISLPILNFLWSLLSDGAILHMDESQKETYTIFFTHVPGCQIQDSPPLFLKRVVPALALRRNVYSQNGEDGILQELLRRLESRSHWVCEFGAWDGIACSNTFRLVEQGDKAVYIEARDDYFTQLLETCKTRPNIYPIHARVETEGDSTLDALLSTTDIPKDFDILSIDIDSSDYQVWKSVSEYSPKIVVIEINSAISPLNETHIYSDTNLEGTSFLPMLRLGQEKGYTLVCHTGNLIFIRNDLCNHVQDLLIPGEECYRSAWYFT